MTLVDTNVLLDVFLVGSEHGPESARRITRALRDGPLSVNEIIAAEIAAAFDREDALWSALEDAHVDLVPFPKAAVFLAGQAFLTYRRRGGTRTRTLSDFLVGAHALAIGAHLLTRDRGFYRDYFPKLRLAE